MHRTSRGGRRFIAATLISLAIVAPVVGIATIANAAGQVNASDTTPETTPTPTPTPTRGAALGDTPWDP